MKLLQTADKNHSHPGLKIGRSAGSLKQVFFTLVDPAESGLKTAWKCAPKTPGRCAGTGSKNRSKRPP